ncbi:HNH endonuclease [Halorubrum tebenquichense]
MSNGEHHDEWGEDLHVHHITRFGAFDSYQKANRLENLVTLCRSCHLGKWEGIPLRPDTRSTAD